MWRKSRQGGNNVFDGSGIDGFGVTPPAPQKARFGIYVHVPFCARVCPYCDFTKTGKFSRDDVDGFFAGAEQQLKALLDQYAPGAKVTTLYMGGGTPSLFPAAWYERLIRTVADRFEIEELTLESNPWGLTRDRLQDYHAVGFRRLTVGGQSLCPQVLSTLGRRHKPEGVLRALEDATAVGFEDIHADLIFGLRPGLRTVAVEDEVAALAAAGATGISAYSLTLEPRTRLYDSGLADEEVACSEYRRIRESCLSRGMRQLEVANFGLREARHNNVYWFGHPYLGVGTGAHGLVPATPEWPFGRRYSVGKDIAEHAPGDDMLPFREESERLFALSWEEPRTLQEYLDEMVFTLLRTPTGIPWHWLERTVPGVASRDILSDGVIAKAVEGGRLAADAHGLALVGSEYLLCDRWAVHLARLLDRLRSRTQ